MKNTLSYLAIGLSLLAIIFSLSGSQLLGAAPNINCNGRAYCTAWNDILFRNASSTGIVGVNSLTATGTVTLSGTNTLSGTSTLSGTNTLSGASTLSGGVTLSSALSVTSSTGSISNKQATSTLGCLKIYQVGATTIASTTYYLVASSTLNTDNFYPLFATSTKPAYCF